MTVGGTVFSDSHNRMIGPCGVHLAEKDQVLADASALLRRLLLFDDYILQSIRFKEFPSLVRHLGVDSVVRLLSAGPLKIECEPLSIGQNSNSIGPREGKHRLPRGSYSFVTVRGSPGGTTRTTSIRASRPFKRNSKMNSA